MQSKFLLVCLLVLFLCRVFTDGLSFSLEYPELTHPLGLSIKHHHGHSDHLGVVVKKNGQDKRFLLSDESDSASIESLEHEHSSHAYTLYYPGEDFFFAVSFFPSNVEDNPDICYQACRYAPPHPPPTRTGQVFI